ncbi:MAG: type II toxin-antitoxin system PrlF family antitoxin [Rhodobacter sp.]|nr:type II toxin-antitoxin system PrlF family antitoxin [Rhodobacter sp.]MCY4168297.1 type II toxin-antitoxin system PrlF family antitoxin [Rhodobacter sp.]MCY4240974.1 type II toxin-antitoxin system PrlF family antitoxin [Rhodobacter sp.]
MRSSGTPRSCASSTTTPKPIRSGWHHKAYALPIGRSKRPALGSLPRQRSPRVSQSSPTVTRRRCRALCAGSWSPIPRSAFLDFIEAGIKAHPERLRAFNAAVYDRPRALVGDVRVDLDEPLSPDCE